MRALHRTIAGGAFGVVAAATVAASSAFACHPGSVIYFSTYRTMPGELVRVEAHGFDPGTAVEIRFGTSDKADVLLGSSTAQAVDLVNGRPQAVFEIRIPADVPWGDYLLVASQNPAKNNPGKASQRIAVGPAPTSTTMTTPTTAVTNNTQVTAPPVPQGVGSISTTGDSAATGVVPAPATGSTPTAASGGDLIGRPAAEAAAALEQSLNEERSAGGQAGLLPSAGTPGAPPVEDLWRGLDPAQAPASLDGPAPPSSPAGAPAGMALLGFGAATLAGIGFAVGRRRLALAVRR